MRTSTEIQAEYDGLKSEGFDEQTDKAYQEAIRRAKLEEQASQKQDFETQVSAILDGTNTIVHTD